MTKTLRRVRRRRQTLACYSSWPTPNQVEEQKVAPAAKERLSFVDQAPWPCRCVIQGHDCVQRIHVDIDQDVLNGRPSRWRCRMSKKYPGQGRRCHENHVDAFVKLPSRSKLSADSDGANDQRHDGLSKRNNHHRRQTASTSAAKIRRRDQGTRHRIRRPGGRPMSCRPRVRPTSC